MKFERVFLLMLTAALIALLGAGCTTANKLADGIASKSLSGSGTVAVQAADIDPATGVPRLRSTVVTGDYASAKNGETALQYRRRKSPSIWNSSAVTEEVTLNFVGSKEYLAKAEELIRADVTRCEQEAGTDPKPPEAAK